MDLNKSISIEKNIVINKMPNQTFEPLFGKLIKNAPGNIYKFRNIHS